MKTVVTEKEGKRETLARYLGCDSGDIKEELWGLYVLGRKEYLVLTEAEAEEKAWGYILGSMWAFNKNFLDSHSKIIAKMDKEVFGVIQGMCEGANDAILAMIDNIDEFVSDAISADGRGHFISSYDGDEIECGEYFIYRIN